jgi:hypothetical protein
MRIVPKDMRRHGVLESLNNDDVAALVEEAEYAEAVNEGYYDEDGNWVYYEEEAGYDAIQEKPEEFVPQPPVPKVAPAHKVKSDKDEVKAAADEAAKAAGEAAKAAAAASQNIVKGLSSFGFGFGSSSSGSSQQKQGSVKQSSGFSLGGLMKSATPQQQPQKQPPKPKLKHQDPNYLKPFTNNMTAKQRWVWANRRIVQVTSSLMAAPHPVEAMLLRLHRNLKSSNTVELALFTSISISIVIRFA